MPKETGLSYRTILRTLRTMETDGLVNEPRKENSEKGGKEKKIYSATFKGALTYLNSIAPKPENYFANNGYHYTHEKANKIILNNLEPLTTGTIASFLENLGKQIDFPIFKQINWLEEHYGIDVFRAIVSTAKLVIGNDKSPSFNDIANCMLTQGKKIEEITITIKEFQMANSMLLREAFTEALAYELSRLNGKGNLHNREMEELFAKLISKIEQKNRSSIEPINYLIQTLKQTKPSQLR
jgi:DNA-binding PadR family transcriptional regulator